MGWTANDVTPCPVKRIIDADFGEIVMHVRTALASIACLVLAVQVEAADGLAVPDAQIVWPQWQARIAVDTPLLIPVSLTAAASPTASTGLFSSRLLGDFYFDAPGLQLPASVGGLRATSGLISGLRSTVQTVSTETLPYLGLGYTGLSLKGGWGITADLGLALENPSSAARAGRALFGNQGFDQALREVRLSPVLQVGVSYAF